jgi:hypothetical protein
MKENKKSEPEQELCQNGTVPQHCFSHLPHSLAYCLSSEAVSQYTLHPFLTLITTTSKVYSFPRLCPKKCARPSDSSTKRPPSRRTYILLFGLLTNT